MRVLVVDNPHGAVTTVQQLDGLGHEVVATDAVGSWRHLRSGMWDAVLIEWPHSGAQSVNDYIRAVRDTQHQSIAVLVVTSKGSAANAEAAFRGGADDFVRKPVSRGELAGRLAQALRFTALLRSAPHAQASLLAARTTRIESIAAWSSFGPKSAEVLAIMTCIPCSVSEGTIPFEAEFAVEVPLVSAGDALEMRVIIEVEHASLSNVGVAMFGGSPLVTAALLDLLLELGNTVAGAFAGDARGDKVELTMGLPTTLSVEDAERRLMAMDARHEVELAADDGSFRLRVHLGSRSKRNIIVPVTKLREGMVLAADVKSPLGVLMVCAGTRVTSNQAERIQELLGASNVVEVADTAA